MSMEDEAQSSSLKLIPLGRVTLLLVDEVTELGTYVFSVLTKLLMSAVSLFRMSHSNLSERKSIDSDVEFIMFFRPD